MKRDRTLDKAPRRENRTVLDRCSNRKMGERSPLATAQLDQVHYFPENLANQPKKLRLTLSFDNICKYLAAEYPAVFVHWLLNIDTNDIQILPTELKLDPIRADTLILLRNTNQILHLEFQTLPTSVPSLSLRMLDYWVRLHRQYDCPIEQVVIFLKQSTSDAVYVEQFTAANTQHRYRVIRLWEQNPAPLLSNPALLLLQL